MLKKGILLTTPMLAETGIWQLKLNAKEVTQEIATRSFTR